MCAHHHTGAFKQTAGRITDTVIALDVQTSIYTGLRNDPRKEDCPARAAPETSSESTWDVIRAIKCTS
jgi:hypothetical protein